MFRDFVIAFGRSAFGALREHVTAAVERAVTARDAGVCQLCGRPLKEGDDSHLHHRKAVALGGRSSVENLCDTHGYCNLRVGTRGWAEAQELAGLNGERWEAEAKSKAAQRLRDEREHYETCARAGRIVPFR